MCKFHPISYWKPYSSVLKIYAGHITLYMGDLQNLDLKHSYPPNSEVTQFKEKSRH